MSDTLVDLISMGAGIYGAILATGLFVHEINKSSRKLHLRFTHMRWGEYQELRVTNVSEKPIEIIEVGVYLTKNLDFLDPFSQKPIEPDHHESKYLPTILYEGNSATFRFSFDYDDILPKGSFFCFVRDSTGKKHTTKNLNIYDLKYHVDVQEKRRPRR